MHHINWEYLQNCRGAEGTCKALPNEALCNCPRKHSLINCVYLHGKNQWFRLLLIIAVPCFTTPLNLKQKWQSGQARNHFRRRIQQIYLITPNLFHLHFTSPYALCIFSVWSLFPRSIPLGYPGQSRLWVRWGTKLPDFFRLVDSTPQPFTACGEKTFERRFGSHQNSLTLARMNLRPKICHMEEIRRKKPSRSDHSVSQQLCEYDTITRNLFRSHSSDSTKIQLLPNYGFMLLTKLHTFPLNLGPSCITHGLEHLLRQPTDTVASPWISSRDEHRPINNATPWMVST